MEEIPMFQGAAGMVEVFSEAEFVEGSNEYIVQALLKQKSFFEGSTPMREISCRILESNESVQQLLSLVGLSKTLGKTLIEVKHEQIRLCQFYIETWMREKPGFCMDEKYRSQISR